MTQPNVEKSNYTRSRRFRWEIFLPQRKAWLQTLILLPFGGATANFLMTSWYFSVNLMAEEGQYPIGVILMVINILLPSLFFSFLNHWIWFMRKQAFPTWYPRAKGLGAGFYATLTIAVSFGIVNLVAQDWRVCSNPESDVLSQTLLCTLDNYSFESKSWFGAWFIIAAYCYHFLNSIVNWRSNSSLVTRADNSPQFSFDENSSPLKPNATSMTIASNDRLALDDNLRAHSIDPITTDIED